MKQLTHWAAVVVASALAISICAAQEKAAGPQPMAHWALDEVKDGAVADSSGHGHTGTLVNMTAANLVDGPNGLKALKLDGNGGRTEISATGPYVHIAGTSFDPAFNFDGKKFTIALWANYTDNSGYIVCQGRGSHPGWGILASNPASLDIGGGQPLILYFKGHTPGKWEHLAAVVDMTALTYALYLNGEQVASGAINPHNQPGPGDWADDIALGARTIGTSGIYPFYKGMLADVYLFDQALTGAQIKALMKHGR